MSKGVTSEDRGQRVLLWAYCGCGWVSPKLMVLAADRTKRDAATSTNVKRLWAHAEGCDGEPAPCITPDLVDEVPRRRRRSGPIRPL